MIRALGHNALNGARLAFFRRVRRSEFVVDLPQTLVLFILSFALGVLGNEMLDALDVSRDPATGTFWYIYLIDAGAFLTAALALSVIQGASAMVMHVIVVVVAAWLVVDLLMYLILAPGFFFAEEFLAFANAPWSIPLDLKVILAFASVVLSIAVLVWYFTVLFRAVTHVFEVSRWRTLLLCVVFLVVSDCPGLLVAYLEVCA